MAPPCGKIGLDAIHVLLTAGFSRQLSMYFSHVPSDDLLSLFQIRRQYLNCDILYISKS